MAAGIFVVGTDTGVGKTLIAAALTGALRRGGKNASYFKPVQSGGINKGGRLVSPDLTFVRAGVELDGDDHLLNPICLEPALAPSVAAELSGTVIDLDKIMAAYKRLKSHHDYLVVEGAGGLLVPLMGTDFLIADLIELLDLPVLVVARSGLGTINHTALTVRCADSLRIRVLGVIINSSNKAEVSLAEKTNPGVIERLTKRPILGVVPYLGEVTAGTRALPLLVEQVAENLDVKRIMATAEGTL